MSGIGFHLLQCLALTIALLLSMFIAWRKLLPSQSRRTLARLARALGRAGRSRTRRWLGQRLQAAQAMRSACGDGGGCGSCNGCPLAARDPRAIAVTIRLHQDPTVKLGARAGQVNDKAAG